MRKTWYEKRNEPVYSKELAEKFCLGVIDHRTLRDICSDEGMPDVATIFRWFDLYPEFELMYERAKAHQAEDMVREMIGIADNAGNAAPVDDNDDSHNSEMLRKEHVQRSKLRIETRQWVAARYKPRRFSNRVVHAGDENAPLVTKDVSQNDREAFNRFVRNYKPEKTQPDDNDDLA